MLVYLSLLRAIDRVRKFMSATAVSIAFWTPASYWSSLTKIPTQEGSSARAAVLTCRMSSAVQM